MFRFQRGSRNRQDCQAFSPKVNLLQVWVSIGIDELLKLSAARGYAMTMANTDLVPSFHVRVQKFYICDLAFKKKEKYLLY